MAGMAISAGWFTFQGGDVLLRSACFLIGVLGFHQLAVLPDGIWSGAAAMVALVAWRRRPLRPLTAVLIGFAWSHAYALITSPATLPDDGRAAELIASGRIVSLVRRTGQLARFEFEADRVEGYPRPTRGPWRLRLSWREPPMLRPGDAWRLPVRLRRAHGYASPGAWDYEGWLHWQGIRYTGYVVEERGPHRLGTTSCCRLNQLRAAMGQAIARLEIGEFARGVIRAITLGDQSGLSTEAKTLFRATGTSHLMAISGLHVGLVAGLGMLTVTAIWARLPILCGRVPARVAGALAGTLLAGVYAGIAGMALPTQRALIMLTVFAASVILRRGHSAAHALAVAAVLVLLWHPPSIVSAGFWLSFVAVAAILAVMPWGQGRSAWYQALLVQAAISVALWPVLTLYAMPVSGLAPLVNLFLVPLFGFVVVPLSLLVVALLLVLPDAAHWLALPLGLVVDGIHQVLDYAVRLPLPQSVAPASGSPGLALLALAAGLLLVPPGFPLRWLALPVFGIFLWPSEPRLRHGEFEVHLLDVGQGLSSVVETLHHTLVFDTGPAYASGFSTAAAVLRPFLATRGRLRVDRLVLSHGDKDHASGVAFVLGKLEVKLVQSGEPARVGHGAAPCVAGERWRWDGVDFEFLHPPAGRGLSGNDASCVLRISNAAGAALFPGDIGRNTEMRLLREQPHKLGSRLVLAAHHGSRGSSDPDFVASVRPDYVLFASGWRNRYGFPATEVVQRWRAVGADALGTALSGTISVHFAADGKLRPPFLHRPANKRFWHHDGGSAEVGLAVSSDD